MFELNKVFLAGRLTRDPELKSLPSGTAVADMGLAVNRRWFDRKSGEKREDTLFIDVSAWDRTAEFCGKYLNKGSGIMVEGRLKMDRWEDKQTGRMVSKINVVADRIQFAESRSDQGREGGGTGEARTASAGSAPSSPKTQPAMDDRGNAGPSAENKTEDDLPF